MDEATQPLAANGGGERKQITAVFIDVVGFSNIASTADAEDLQVWLEDFYAQTRRIVEAHDGEVTEYLGDGVVALFGLNRADELAAPKAVNAAMSAMKDIQSDAWKDFALQLRAGVATGEVAVRASHNADNLPRATGMVTTLAQRIQEKAAPGTVMISESTQSLLRGSIMTEPLTNQMLKGFAEPQTLFRPLAAQSGTPTVQPPFFVGRTAELARIRKSAKPCLVVGQAGIGKSALARHIAAGAKAAKTIAADGVHTRASYQPFNQWIMRHINCTLPDFGDIQTGFASLAPDAQRALALVLGLPEGQRLLAEQTNIALKALIEESLWSAIQSVQPEGLLIFEDLHWLDNASFGVLVHILQSEAAGRYQILMTSREDTKIGKYLNALPISVIPLEALSDAEARIMLVALANGAEALNDYASLIDRAAGIPLFLEQLFKRSTLEGTASATVPGSLMDLLADQIDATGSTKPVLQCAAVVGQTFDIDLLGAIAAEHAPLTDHLAKACSLGVLQKVGRDNWAFSHALLHQAAYQGMLRRTRINYHAQIAAHLQNHHADAVHRSPTLLTDHLTLAQQHIPAIQNYLTVSQWALFQGALDDAEAHILAGISLCGQAPSDVDVRDLEIACHTALGSIRMQKLGFTAEPVKEAFEKVASLAAAQNEYSAANGPAFYGSFTHAILSGDKDGSDHFSKLLKVAADTVSPEATNNEIVLASLNVDVSLHFYSGAFEKQFEEFAALRKIYDITRHGAMIANYGVDTFAAAQMFEIAGRSICGDTHLVDDLIAETDAHQELLNIPVMLPYAQIWGAVPLFYAGQTERAVARVVQGLQNAKSQTAVFWQVTGAAWLNVMDPAQSETAEGLAGFDQVIKTHEMIGAHVGLPYFRAHYALALARHGQIDAAYQASLHATRENEENGLLCWYPEVLRIHADVCRMSGRDKDAAHYLEEAAGLAQSQSARLWLLRARLDQFKSGNIGKDALLGALDGFDPRALPPEVIIAKAILAAG